MMKRVASGLLLVAAAASTALAAEGDMAVYFGTFDPFHNGHLKVIEASLPEIGVDKVWLVPERLAGVKAPVPGSSFEDRLAMCRAVASRWPKMIGVVDKDKIEAAYRKAKLEGYSMELIKQLEAKLAPGKVLFQLTGIDGFNKLLRAGQLPHQDENRVVVVVDQPGYKLDPEALRAAGVGKDKLLFLHPEALDIKGMDVQGKVARGDDVGDLVPGVIKRYITDRGLYRKAH